ncbi:MAG: hypothetical protein OXH92_21080 [Bryobacterales bacterium]|nr:hypothetical protein [Bryobacterales bacterium]
MTERRARRSGRGLVVRPLRTHGEPNGRKGRDSCLVMHGARSRPSSGDWGWEPLAQAFGLAESLALP